MPRRTGKREEMRSFSFRMPKGVFDDLEAVARVRGVDLSGVLNWLISEARPRLMAEIAKHEKEMAEAISSRVWEKADSPAESLRELRDLLGKLQDEYQALSEQVLGKNQRRAG